MRQDAAAVDVNLVANGHVVTENSHILETGPATDGAVPANNRRLDPSVVLDLGALEQDASLQADAVTDDDIRANGDIRAYSAVLSNLGRGVNHDVAAVDVGLGRRGQLLAALLGEGGEVQAGAAEEVFGLANVHPEALEVERVQLVVGNHGGECLLLDGRGAELDALQHRGVEDVHAGVDAVADELDGFLDEAVDAGGVVGLVDNDTVLGRLLDLGDDNGALIAVGLVELEELLEGIVADDVGVEDEEGRVILAEDALSKLEGAGGVEGLRLNGELNVDVVFLLVLNGRAYAISLDVHYHWRGNGEGMLRWRGGGPKAWYSEWAGEKGKGGSEGSKGVMCRTHLGQELFHDFWAVVDGKDNVGHASGDESLDLVHNHGLVAELHQRLGERQGLDGAAHWSVDVRECERCAADGSPSIPLHPPQCGR